MGGVMPPWRPQGHRSGEAMSRKAHRGNRNLVSSRLEAVAFRRRRMSRSVTLTQRWDWRADLTPGAKAGASPPRRRSRQEDGRGHDRGPEAVLVADGGLGHFFRLVKDVGDLPDLALLVPRAVGIELDAED